MATANRRLYCIEVDRSGICEENVVIHCTFSSAPTRKDVSGVIIDEDIGYDDDYCMFEYYPLT